jgi:filamentous hemagglutinin
LDVFGGDDSDPKIHEGQQGKHVRGHNNFDPGRSELSDPNPQSLLDKGAGTGEQVGNTPVGQPGSKERVDFGKNIGDYVDRDTGERSPTSIGIIHYGSKGAHIGPARPRK